MTRRLSFLRPFALFVAFLLCTISLCAQTASSQTQTTSPEPETPPIPDTLKTAPKPSKPQTSAPTNLRLSASLRVGGILSDGKVDYMTGQTSLLQGPSFGAEIAAVFYPSAAFLDDWSIPFSRLRARCQATHTHPQTKPTHLHSEHSSLHSEPIHLQSNSLPYPNAPFQYPRRAGVGVAMGYWCFSPEPLLGHALSLYTFLDIPLVSTPRFTLGVRPGIGLAFLTKTYRNTVQPDYLFDRLDGANRSVGSVTNFHFPESLYAEFLLSRGYCLSVDLGWYHFSNGSTVQPNSGYNIFALGLGVSKSLSLPTATEPRLQNNTAAIAKAETHAPKTTTSTAETHTANNTANHPLPKNAPFSKPWSIEFAFTAGARQVYYRDRATFFVASAQAAAYWHAHAIFRLGAGLDLFYDGAYRARTTSFQKTYLAAARPSDCYRLGLSLQPEFLIGRLSVGTHVGFYLIDPVKSLEPYVEAAASPSGRIEGKGMFYSYDILKAGSAGYPDGWLYTQIVLRYHLPYHLMVQASMKAHLTKVEFVSLGLGAYF